MAKAVVDELNLRSVEYSVAEAGSCYQNSGLLVCSLARSLVSQRVWWLVASSEACRSVVECLVGVRPLCVYKPSVQ